MKKTIFIFSFALSLLCCTKDNAIDTDTQPTPTIMPKLPFGTFSLGGPIYDIHDPGTMPPENNYWEIGGWGISGAEIVTVHVFLPDTLAATTSKVYTLQDDYTTLTAGKACIIMTYFIQDGPFPIFLYTYTSTAGGKLRTTPIPLNSSNSYGGYFKINFIFNDIEAKEDSTGLIIHLFGNFATP